MIFTKVKERYKIILIFIILPIVLGYAYMATLALIQHYRYAEFTPLPPEVTKLPQLSHPVYVGSCCSGYQIGYYIKLSRSEVIAFYKAKIDKAFVPGVFPATLAFETFGFDPSAQTLYYCRPDCSAPNLTSHSLILMDARDSTTGTWIVFQVHFEGTGF